jgi:hypothetical protein
MSTSTEGAVIGKITPEQSALLWANMPWRNQLQSAVVAMLIFAPVAIIELLFFKLYRWDKKAQQMLPVGWGMRAALLTISALFMLFWFGKLAQLASAQ